jgi:DNA-binding transcriptional LysR family regulator
MDIIKLEAFLTLAETGNFTRAADELFISQPALSKQISSLEEELKVPLFNRSKKATSLTLYGEYFVPYAKNMLANYRNAKEHILQIENLNEGTLRFGATNFIGVYLIPFYLAKFQELFPGITLHFTINSSRNILSKLSSYELEFILLSDYIEIDEKRFARIPWYQDELRVIVGKKCPLFEQDSVSLQDLAQYTYITKSPSSSIYKFIEHKMGNAFHPRNYLFISHQDAIKNAVLYGMGFSLLSPKAVDFEVHSGLLKALPIEGFKLKREIEIVHESKRHLTPASEKFIEILKMKGHREKEKM